MLLLLCGDAPPPLLSTRTLSPGGRALARGWAKMFCPPLDGFVAAVLEVGDFKSKFKSENKCAAVTIEQKALHTELFSESFLQHSNSFFIICV